MNKLFPSVSNLAFLPGYFDNLKLVKYFFISKKVNAFINFDIENQEVRDIKEANLIFEVDKSIAKQAYRLVIKDNIIRIFYSENCGAFYATRTLKQILKNDKVNNLEIKDFPAIKTRGFMLDISRDKVPTVETVKKVISIMAELKMNHLELYVEGFSFEYKSFEKYLEEDGFITLKEYQELEKFANRLFIDLVPNQNGFGHMGKWLELDEFKDLAVCPEGINLWGRWRKPTTLDPLNSKSLELVEKMYNDMLPFTKSKYFNMNFDEPFELGHGKTEGMNEEELYLDYTKKVYEIIKKYHKTPLIWGDVLLKHDGSWNKLPKDMLFIDWGYDANYPFMKHAKVLKKNGIKFMTAPGTTSWCSFFGRYIDWYENIKNAVDAIVYNQGEGTILTDWGDFGHLQFLPVSYAPLVYMGLYSWSQQEGCILIVRDYLNSYIFNDSNKVLGDLFIDLSNYYRYDVNYSGNNTRLFLTFMWASVAMMDALPGAQIQYFKDHMIYSYLSYPKFRILRKFLNSKLEELDYLAMSDKVEETLIKREIVQSVKLIKMILKVNVAFNMEIDLNKRIEYLEEVKRSRDEYLEEQKELWVKRNKKGGLESSLIYLKSFYDFANETLNYLSKGEQE